MEQQTAGRTTGIDLLVEHDKVHLLGGYLSCDLGKVEDGAREAVKPRHHELVTLADESQRLAERLTLVAACAALLLLEDLVTTMDFELA